MNAEQKAALIFALGYIANQAGGQGNFLDSDRALEHLRKIQDAQPIPAPDRGESGFGSSGKQ